MCSPADLTATTTEQHEHESNDGEDDANGPEDGHGEQQPDEHEDESSNDHVVRVPEPVTIETRSLSSPVRRGWPALARVVCVMVGTIPVVIVGRQIVDAFGWSPHSLVGFVMMLAVYGVIVSATRFVLATTGVG